MPRRARMGAAHKRRLPGTFIMSRWYDLGSQTREIGLCDTQFALRNGRSKSHKKQPAGARARGGSDDAGCAKIWPRGVT